MRELHFLKKSVACEFRIYTVCEVLDQSASSQGLKIFYKIYLFKRSLNKIDFLCKARDGLTFSD